MSEQEIKLHIPPAARKAVSQAVLKGEGAQRIALRALYFDTPDRALARAGVALRIRLEGRKWVQTLKMPGPDSITRLELNHPRPAAELDLSLYQGTPAAEVIAALEAPLSIRYETDVKRITRKVRTRYGTVELACDSGLLRAGTLELPINELEFELVSGRQLALFTLARRWQQQHGLIMDLRSKAERGDALATAAQEISRSDSAPSHGDPQRHAAIQAFWAPRMARNIKLDGDASSAAALTAIGIECLEQIVHNAAILAEIDTDGLYRAGRPEHIHQLRVGIRRLRSAWRLFQDWVEAVPDSLTQDIRAHFNAFGDVRDGDVLSGTVTPRLLAAGMPPVPLPTADSNDATDPRVLASDPAFQGWLLDLLGWTLGIPPAARSGVRQPTPAPTTEGNLADVARAVAAQPTSAGELRTPPTLRRRLDKRLQRWHLVMVRDGARFAALSETEKHELRKRGKRLRYALSFATSVLPAARSRAYRKRLAAVQELLGEFNDLVVAREAYRSLTSQHPQAWFALGWIAARLDALAQEAEIEFGRLARLRPFSR